MKKAVVVLLAVMLQFGNVWAQEEAQKPGPTPEQMKAWEEASTPGEEHKVLNAFVGDWKTVSSCRMSPEAPLEKSEGKSEISWILNGRFLEQEFDGEAMGKPFEGKGLIGYDKMRKEYTAVWLDSMGTGIVKATAQYDATTKTISEVGTFACPMTGKLDMTYRSEWKIVDDKHFTYAMFMQDEKGNEFKSMEIAYEKD